ncbi:MAG: endonuclease/exonuclease/phosphatase family protein [Uliginosibacterium sp.]|nr:endonuclease/exonuclease/phosphatase family protein [Uliginosibacterium sp.]
MVNNTLGICTYNIHKGFSQLNRRMAIHELRAQLLALDPDISFLQEVQGQHLKHADRHANWPPAPQHEFLAGDALHAAYGRNAIYDHGHHGNAVLSRYPIIDESNHDVSIYRLEQRGILHCEIAPRTTPTIHCICVHLSLTEHQRRQQLVQLAEYVEKHIPDRAPLIIAGDFNDWRRRANDWLPRRLDMVEAYTTLHGQPARSYPSHLPLLHLDRIYLRGFEVISAKVFCGGAWSKVSDHALLFASVRLT